MQPFSLFKAVQLLKISNNNEIIGNHEADLDGCSHKNKGGD